MSQNADRQLPESGTIDGLTYTQDLNSILRAIMTKNSGVAAPDDPFDYEEWVDESNDPAQLIKIWDKTQWVTVGSLNTSTHVFTPYSGGSALGTAAVKNTGTSGDAIPLLNAHNAFSGNTRIPWDTVASSAGALTLNFNSNGNNKRVVLSEAISAITLSNPADGGMYNIKFKQAAGLYGITGWPSAVKWPDGVAPTAPTATGRVLRISLQYDGTDAVYEGSYDAEHY